MAGDVKDFSVLHVTPYFPPDHIGGVGEVVRLVHDGLLERGVESEVLTSGTSPSDPRVHRLGRSTSSFALRSWQGLAMSRRFDILHVHHGEALALLAAVKLISSGPKVLLTLHVSMHEMIGSLEGGDEGEPDSRAWPWRSPGEGVRLRARALMDSASMRLVDAVSFVSRAGSVEVLGEERGRTAYVVHNAAREPNDREEDRTVDHVEMLFVGTPTRRKRVGLLPVVLEGVKREVPHARLRIVGFSAEDAPWLARRFAAYGCEDSVVWEGEVDYSLVAPYYRASDLLVLPSAYEGLPMAILEAMARGLPCVVTDVGGNREAVADGRNGFLVRSDDPDAMARACIRVLQDQDLRAAMRQEALATAKESFGLDRQIEEYMTIYNQVLKRSH